MSRILVIEDNEGNLELMRVVLEMAGHEVEGSQDATLGLELVENWQPDLVLMDMHMPGMDGFEATRILKSKDNTRKIPVIAVTAISDHADEERVLGCGCDGYIAKPVDTRNLAAQIEDFLKKGKRTHASR